jgi:hypothetical protein
LLLVIPLLLVIKVPVLVAGGCAGVHEDRSGCGECPGESGVGSGEVFSFFVAEVDRGEEEERFLGPQTALGMTDVAGMVDVGG